MDWNECVAHTQVTAAVLKAPKGGEGDCGANNANIARVKIQPTGSSLSARYRGRPTRKRGAYAKCPLELQRLRGEDFGLAQKGDAPVTVGIDGGVDVFQIRLLPPRQHWQGSATFQGELESAKESVLCCQGAHGRSQAPWPTNQPMPIAARQCQSA